MLGYRGKGGKEARKQGGKEARKQGSKEAGKGKEDYGKSVWGELNAMQIERWILAMRARVRALFRREAMDRELDEELRYHVERTTEENIARGMTPEEARRQALIAAGGIDQAKEKCRDGRQVNWLHDLVQDTRFGLRMLGKSPGFTAIAVMTLALGIGANTAIFSLIDALLLRALPVSNPQELVFLQWSAHKRPKFHSSGSYGDCGGSSCSFSLPFFEELRGQSDVFSSVTASGGSLRLDLSGNGPADTVFSLTVAGNYFETLGVRPIAGRMIEPADDSASATPVAVLSYGYWQKAFGGTLSAIGKTVSLNGVPTTIVGVAEQRFTGLTPGSTLDAWIPLSLREKVDLSWRPGQDDAGSIWMLIVARLSPQVPREKAQAAVSLLFRNQMIHGAQPLSAESDAPTVALIPAQSGLRGARGTYSASLFVLMTAVGIVLLIASANVAGLLLARSTVRQKEMAVRLALGARRGRVIRQLLTENLLLSFLGGVLGILFALAGARAIIAFVSTGSSQPLGFEAALDGRVLLFTATVALLTGTIFGLAPAMRGTRVDLTPALKDGARLMGGAGKHPLSAGNLLVVGQVALTMIVLVGSGLVVRTLQNLRSVDPGFDTSNVLNFRVNPILIGYRGDKLAALYRDLQGRLSAIPGVTSATFSSQTLLSGSLVTTDIHLPGAADKSTAETDYLEVGPGYFATMRIPFVEGRDFLPGEYGASIYEKAVSAPRSPAANGAAISAKAASAGLAQPVIVNETFVRRFLGGPNPLGQHFMDRDAKPDDPGFVIVGVVGDTKYSDLRRELMPVTFVPVTSGGAFEVRTAANPEAIIPAVRSIVNEVDSNLPISNVITESASVDRVLFEERLIARFSSFFGALALALACIGLYGLLSYEVTRKTREIGIRMALGAGRRDVLGNVVGHGIALACAGLALGITASFGLTRFLGSLLYDVKPGDPRTLIAVTMILLIVALAACYVPARRAMRVDPMVALRHE